MEAGRERGGLAVLLAALVLVHLLLSLWHGAAHLEVPVALSPAQQAFVALVILLLPLLGAALLWSRWRRAAALLVALALFASLLFGFVNHYVLDSPDNVVELPAQAWRPAFVISAAAIAVSESVGSVVALLAVLAWSPRER